MRKFFKEDGDHAVEKVTRAVEDVSINDSKDKEEGDVTHDLDGNGNTIE